LYKVDVQKFYLFAGKIHLVQSGDSDVSQSLEELSKCNQHLIIFYERNTSQHIVKCRGKNLIGSISVLFPALRYVCEQSYKTCENKQVSVSTCIHHNNFFLAGEGLF
jgi:hypothetical protein